MGLLSLPFWFGNEPGIMWCLSFEHSGVSGINKTENNRTNPQWNTRDVSASRKDWVIGGTQQMNQSVGHQPVNQKGHQSTVQVVALDTQFLVMVIWTGGSIDGSE